MHACSTSDIPFLLSNLNSSRQEIGILFLNLPRTVASRWRTVWRFRSRLKKKDAKNPPKKKSCKDPILQQIFCNLDSGLHLFKCRLPTGEAKLPPCLISEISQLRNGIASAFSFSSSLVYSKLSRVFLNSCINFYLRKSCHLGVFAD